MRPWWHNLLFPPPVTWLSAGQCGVSADEVPPDTQSQISQQIVVDGAVTAVIVYDLDRRPSNTDMPSAELVEIQAYRGQDTTTFNTPQHSHAYRYTPTYETSPAQFAPHKRPEQTAFQCDNSTITSNIEDY